MLALLLLSLALLLLSVVLPLIVLHRCPYNFFRTSNDIQASWGAVYRNFQSVAKHQPWWGSQGEVVTGPGCFAYPDTMEVGNLQSFVKASPDKLRLKSFAMDRSNFGAWVIVSSPLILGHDLTDDVVMDKIWPIITNRHAIRISQSFGASNHPGGLVRAWAPPSADVAPANRTQFALALPPGGLSGGGVWSVPTPAGATGPVRHTLDGVETCMGVATKSGHGLPKRGTVELTACASPLNASQTWTQDSEGKLKQAISGQCLVLDNGRGPGLELFTCKNQSSAEWTRSNNTLCSQALCHGSGCASRSMCLAARNEPSDGGDGTMQLWAKPQPNGAVAVFLLNNLPVGSRNVSADVSLADLNFTHGSGGSSVFDVWAQMALPPLPPGARGLRAAPIGSFDSVLLLITPTTL